MVAQGAQIRAFDEIAMAFAIGLAPSPSGLPVVRVGRYSAASRRVPPSQAVTTSSAMAPGGSAEIPTSVHVG